MTEESEPVYDEWGARIPDTVLNNVNCRVAQKTTTIPKIHINGRPLPIEHQPEAVRAANPDLVPTPDGRRQAAVRRVADRLAIDPAALLALGAIHGPNGWD